MKKKADNEIHYLKLKKSLSAIQEITGLAMRVGENEAARSLGLPLEQVKWALQQEHIILDDLLRIDKQRRATLLKSFDVALEKLKNLPECSNISSIIIEDREYCTLMSELPARVPPSCPICAALERQGHNVEKLGNKSYIVQHEHKYPE